LRLEENTVDDLPGFQGLFFGTVLITTVIATAGTVTPGVLWCARFKLCTVS
jgi:hypothetical protein